MRCKYSIGTAVLAAGVAIAGTAFAQFLPPPPVANVGQLADATADLVIANAMADRKHAEEKAAGQSASGAHAGSVGVTQGQGGDGSSVAVLSASKVGGITYASVRDSSGSISSVPAGSVVDGSLRVEATATGACLVNAIGAAKSCYPDPKKQAAIQPGVAPGQVSVPVPVAPIETPPPPPADSPQKEQQ